MPEKNSISWTALISGFARNGQGNKTLQLFAEIVEHRIKPDQFTFSSCLTSCASLSSLKHGIQNADRYSKCGCLELGWYVFNILGNKQDVILWNTIIPIFSQYGHSEDAMNMLHDMIRTGVKPDQISFVFILNTCSRFGLVQEGLDMFNSMNVEHGVIPSQEHYACLIDILGRESKFDMVVYHLEKMTFKPDEPVWNALLGHCKIHGNMELGIIAAEHLIELNPRSSAAYIALSDIYTALGKWESIVKVRRLMNERFVKEELGGR